MSAIKEEIKTPVEEEEEDVEIEEDEDESQEQMDEDVQYNQNARWLEQIFNAPGFSKWRANKALEEGKKEELIMNYLVDYNMKIKTCNDIADFIMSKCDPKEALRRKPQKKNEALDKILKKANKKYWSVIETPKSKENTKPKKN